MSDVPQLSVEEARVLFLKLSESMVACRDTLTHADQQVGDGDHGLAIERGFSAVAQMLETERPETVDALFTLIGRTLLRSMGGASGPIFGSLFAGGARSLDDTSDFDAEALAHFLAGGLQLVQERGKAQVGDKTVVDALKPAADKAGELRDAPLSTAMAAAAAAAAEGCENTKNLIARFGKSKTLGDRALDHVDPGALSFSLMMNNLNGLVEQTR